MSEDTSPVNPTGGPRGRPQPFRGPRIPRVIRARLENHGGPWPGVRLPPLERDGGVLLRRGPRHARGVAPPAPFARPLRAHCVGLPHVNPPRRIIHGVKRAPCRCFKKPPGRSRYGWGSSCSGHSRVPFTMQGRPRSPRQRAGEWGAVALRRGEPSVHPGRCARGPAGDLLQSVIAELPHKVPKPEHVLEKFVHGGPSRRVVAGD